MTACSGLCGWQEWNAHSWCWSVLGWQGRKRAGHVLAVVETLERLQQVHR